MQRLIHDRHPAASALNGVDLPCVRAKFMLFRKAVWYYFFQPANTLQCLQTWDPVLCLSLKYDFYACYCRGELWDCFLPCSSSVISVTFWAWHLAGAATTPRHVVVTYFMDALLNTCSWRAEGGSVFGETWARPGPESGLPDVHDGPVTGVRIHWPVCARRSSGSASFNVLFRSALGE